MKYYFLNRPVNRDIRKSTIKMKNNILAMEAAPAAIPPKPKTAAIIATMKKISAQRNIWSVFKVTDECTIG